MRIKALAKEGEDLVLRFPRFDERPYIRMPKGKLVMFKRCTMHFAGMGSSLAIILSFTLFLSGCGGGSSSTSDVTASATPSAVTGTSNLGIVVDGTVSAYKIEGGIKGAQLASATTAADGSFSLDVGSYAGPVLLELTNSGAATYLNEVTGGTSLLPAQPIRSVIAAVTSAPLAITPLTEIVAEVAIRKMNGTTDAAKIAEAASQVGAAFLGGDNPITTIPHNIQAVSAGDASADRYASLLAGFAVVANNTSYDLQQQAASYAAALFDANGAPQAATGLAGTEDVAALNTATAAYDATAVGLSTIGATAAPSGVANIAEAALGNTYYVIYSRSGMADFTTLNDAMVPALITIGSPASTVTQLDGTAIDAAAATTLNADGSFVITAAGSTFHGNITPDGQAMAGAAIVDAAASIEFIFGVKKRTAAITGTDVAGSYDFVRAGRGNTSGVYYATEQGTAVFDAVGGIAFSSVYTEAHAGGTELPVVTTGATGTYTIDSANADNVVIHNGVDTDTAIVLSEDGQYAVIYELDPAAINTVHHGVGFAIRRATATPVIEATNYHYFSLWMNRDASGVFTGNYGASAGLATIGAAGSVSSVEDELDLYGPLFDGYFTGVSGGAGTMGLAVNGALSLTFTDGGAFEGFYSANGNVMIGEDPVDGVFVAIRQ